MKRVLSAILSAVMVISAVFCIDFSAYSSENQNSYFNQFSKDVDSAEALSYFINEEIDTLFFYIDIANIYDYAGGSPTKDFVAFVSGPITSAIHSSNSLTAVLEEQDESFIPFDVTYYSYLDSIELNALPSTDGDFLTLYSIANDNWSDDPEVQDFASELKTELESSLKIYEDYYAGVQNDYYTFMNVMDGISQNFPDVFFVDSPQDVGTLIGIDGTSFDEYTKSHEIEPFISYVESISSVYSENYAELSMEEAVYYTFATPLILVYPVYNAAVTENNGLDYEMFAQNFTDLSSAMSEFTVSQSGYYSDFQKTIVDGIFENAQIFERNEITNDDLIVLSEIFNGHLTKTATVAAVELSDLNELIKYYLESDYFTDEIYQTLDDDFKNFSEDNISDSLEEWKRTINGDIYYPYVISKYFECDSAGLSLVNLFNDFGLYYTGSAKTDLIHSLENSQNFSQFDLDANLESDDNKDTWIYIANEYCNETLGGFFDNTVIKNIINSVLSADLDISAVTTDLLLRFAQEPAKTVFEVLPAVLAVLDDAVLPMIFNAEDDVYYGLLDSILLSGEDSPLYNMSQDYENEIGEAAIGIGQLGWDLNTVLPNILDYLLGEKTETDFEMYSGVYDSSVPVLTNIYYIDSIFAQIKNGDTIDAPFINNIFVILRNTVQEYLDSQYADDYKASQNGTAVNSGLNNVFVSLPRIVDLLEDNFADFISLDRSAWTYTGDQIIITDSNGASENGFLKALKNIASNADAENSLDMFAVKLSEIASSVFSYVSVLTENESSLSEKAPFLFSLVKCVDLTGDSSPLVFGLNNAFDLNDKSYAFTSLSNVSSGTMLFLVCNIENLVLLISEVIEANSGATEDSEPVPIDKEASNRELSDIQISRLTTTAEDVISEMDEKILSIIDETLDSYNFDFLDIYFDILKNEEFTNERLNQIITEELYGFAEDFVKTQILTDSETLNEFIHKFIIGMFSPAAIAAYSNDTDISAQLSGYGSWEELSDSGNIIDWGMTENSEISFFNAFCNAFPMLQRVADIVVNETDVYSVHLSEFYKIFNISVDEKLLDSSLSKIITPVLMGGEVLAEEGVFSAVLINFENLVYIGNNINLFNSFIDCLVDLTVNEAAAVVNLLTCGIDFSYGNINGTKSEYFEALGMSVDTLLSIAPEFADTGLIPDYYDVDITGLSKAEVYETLFCNHSYEVISYNSPTCISEGIETKVCSKCGKEVQSYIPATGHSYADGVCVNCGEKESSKYFYYAVLEDGTAEITGYDGLETELVIPSEIDGYTVTHIGDSAFFGCYSLTEITIPDSVTSIGDYAFADCNSLTDVYYLGSEEKWNDISVGAYNEYLLKANVHFEKGHIHTYDSGKVLVSVNCTHDGLVKYTCTECGDTYTETIPAPGHSFVNNVCANCGSTIDSIKLYETKTAVISKSDDYKYFEFVPESSGSYTFFSDTIYDTEGAVYDSDMQRLAYDGLSIGSSGFSVTYNFEKGKTYYLGAGFSGYSTGSFDVTLCIHEYDDQNAQVIDPTCAAAGYTQNICVHCGHIQKSDYVASLKHDYEITETVAATCERSGYTSYVCSVCGDKCTEYNYSLKHSFVNGICEKCGEIVQTITLSETKEIEISLPGDYKYLAFVPFESGEYSFISESDGYTFANLYNSEMDSMVASSSSGTANGFSVSYNLEAGETYYLEIGYRYDDSTGTFNVVINKNCVHNYKSSIVEPTCTVNGYTEHTCTLCGNSYRDNYISAAGHKWNDGIITTQSTCYSTGLKTYTCENCSSTKTEIVDMTPHAYTAVVTQPTCTNQGYTTYICKYCEDSFISDYTAPFGHAEVIDEAVDPTCTETGLTEGKHCSRCNEILVEQETIDALGHSFTDYISNGNATCTEDGTKTAKCDRCDVTDTVTDKGSALGHDEVIDEAVEPTCTETGLTEGKHCARCDEVLVKQEVVDALGHSFTDYISNGNATCTEDGTKTAKCDRCDVTDTVIDKGSALGHDEVIDEAVEPTCTETGLTEGKHCARCNEVLVKQEVVDALGHNWDSGVITKDPSCKETGVKTYTCKRCAETRTETLDKTEHTYTAMIVKPTCTEKGYTEYTCQMCSDVLTADYVEALGHEYSTEWTIDKEATCTSDGSKSHHCVRCDNKNDVTVIKATGHSFGDWLVHAEATCTENGEVYRKCSACGFEETMKTESLGHNFGEWSVTKPATVLCEGEEQRVCARCGEIETHIIDKIAVDIENTDKYGLANFTVVNAQTKEPIKNASLFISTENDGENTFFTDENGKVSIILPVGQNTVSAYADGCLARNVNINVKSGTNNIPLIGLSDLPIYDAQITHHLMTKEEIEEAGIDVSATDNQHVYKYELQLDFEPEIDWESIVAYFDDDGNYLGGYYGCNGGSGGSGGGSGSSGEGSGSSGEGSGTNGLRGIKVNDEITVYPVKEYFYLIVRGKVSWLKEMFDVEMLVLNNSMTDTLEDLNATIDLPDGLSLATMYGEQQALTQQLEDIKEGGSGSVHWYVRGDKAGSYSLKATLTGKVMPFEEEINDIFVADKTLQVYAGDALRLDFEVPNAAYYAEDYPIKITLKNVSDRTLYDVNHMVQIEQGMEIYYSDGTSKKKIENSNWKSIGVEEFNPGDEIIIETSVNIFFKSEIMQRQLENLIGVIDNVESLISAVNAVQSAVDIVGIFTNAVTGAMKGIDEFIESSAATADKLALAYTLKELLVDCSSKFVNNEDALLDTAVAASNSGLNTQLNQIVSNPEEWFSDKSPEEIAEITQQFQAVKDYNEHLQEQQAIDNFDIFDSLRTLVSAIPIRFALKGVTMTEDEDNTTRIPYSYHVTDAGPQYFGVSDVSSYLTNIGKAIMAETYEETVPSYIQLIPGLDDPFNYDEIKKEIIAVENEIKQFKTKDATGKTTFRAYVVRNDSSALRARLAAVSANTNGFILSSDNETAVYENGVLTFTGDGYINVTPTSLAGGTLVIEDSAGNTYTYDIQVVEQHECSASQWQTVLSPTQETDGFAVKRCDICNDILDVKTLSAESCNHIFDGWVIESGSTAETKGVRSRTCTLCGYKEVEFTPISETPPEQAFEYIVLEDGTAQITDYTGSETELVIPSEIDGHTVTSLRESALYHSPSLVSVSIPETVTDIGYKAFGHCMNLTDINVADGNENYCSVDGVLFSKDKKMIVSYPAGKTQTAYSIPEGVENISSYAFRDNEYLESITIPDGVTSIGTSAFESCTSLADISFPESVVSVGVDAVYNTAYFKDDSNWVDSVLYVDHVLIMALDSIQGKYEIRDGTKVIVGSAFDDCRGLTEVVIPDSVTTIVPAMFINCTGLQSVTIPETVTEIGAFAFDGCSVLTDVYFEGSESQWNRISVATGNEVLNNITIHFGKDSLLEVEDGESGVTVAEDALEVLPGNTELVVEKVSETTTGVSYNISLQKNGEEIQPNGTVTVKIPVPEGMDGNACKVYRQESDGSYTDMNAVYQDGYMVFTTDHFSRYILTTAELGESEILYGDANGDGSIDMKDVVLLRKYMANYNYDTESSSEVVEPGADANGDGSIDMKDVVLLRKYLANYDYDTNSSSVVLGPQ